jgi:type I restriction enzyme S subunit
MIPEDNLYIQSQDIALIRCKERLDPLFCYYLLPSNLVKSQLAAAAQQTKIRHTTPDRIKDITVFVPELEEQRLIGKTLYSIDQKIENNRTINRNLTLAA